MKKFFKQTIFLLLIILSAFILRFYQFDSIPEGFHSDEAAFGYNAYSFLETGKDEYGKVFPLSLKSFGDYKGAVYAYLTMPFVATMGLTEGAVRLPSVLFGTLYVFLIYLVVLQLTKDKKLGLLAAGVGAISPIGIFLSRVQSDPLVSVFFIVLGLYLFLLWVEKRNTMFLLLTGFFWLVSFFTYASPRVFIPFLLILLCIFYGKELFKQKRLLFIPIFIVVFVVDLFLFVGTSKERFSQLSVLSSPVVMLPLEEQIREDGNDAALVARTFHNKVIAYSTYFFKNYSEYLSADFLFLKGGQPTRETTPGFGILYLIELPFLLFGLYLLLVQRKKWGIMIVAWLFASPALLALAVDESPNVHRFFIASLPFAVVIAFGILQFFTLLKGNKLLRNAFIVLIPSIFVFSLAHFLHQMFVHQPVRLPYNRGFAYKELVTEMKKLYPDYKQIVVTKAHASPYIYVVFYNKYDPAVYQKEGSPRDLDYSGFDKYFFTPLDCPFNLDSQGVVTGEPGVLYINKGTCKIPPYNTKVIKTVNWRDGEPAFTLLEYDSSASAQNKNNL